jgi:hypothetical protein
MRLQRWMQIAKDPSHRSRHPRIVEVDAGRFLPSKRAHRKEGDEAAGSPAVATLRTEALLQLHRHSLGAPGTSPEAVGVGGQRSDTCTQP